MGYRAKTFKEILPSLQTGDVVLFHGNEEVSRIVEIIQRSQWTHVGMVVKPCDIGLSTQCGNRPLLWHSTPKLNMKDVELDTKDSGPEIVYLDELLELLKDYQYIEAVRNMVTDREPEMMKQLHRFIEKVHQDAFPSLPHLVMEYIEANIRAMLKHFFHKKYANSVMGAENNEVWGYIEELMKQSTESLIKDSKGLCKESGALHGFGVYGVMSSMKNIINNNGMEDKKNAVVHEFIKEAVSLKLPTHFCSELVAETYIAMGLLSEDEIPASFSPKTFSSKGKVHFLNYTKLEDEMIITF